MKTAQQKFDSMFDHGWNVHISESSTQGRWQRHIFRKGNKAFYMHRDMGWSEQWEFSYKSGNVNLRELIA